MLIRHLVNNGVGRALHQAGHATLAKVGLRKDHLLVNGRRKALDGTDLVAKLAADAALFDDLQSKVGESVEEFRVATLPERSVTWVRSPYEVRTHKEQEYPLQGEERQLAGAEHVASHDH